MANFPRKIILDVGASNLRVAEIVSDSRGGPVLNHLRSQELGVDPSKAADLFPALLQGVENLIKEAGIKSGSATVCLGGPSVFTRMIKLPLTDPSQVGQMVGFEAQQAIPAIEAACWDFQLFAPGEGNPGELEALILAMKRDMVEETMAAASKAGLRTDTVELAPTALINAFRYNYPEVETCTLILEIGARATNIVIVEGKKVFCRIVPLGGASVTQAIANELQESFAGAETLKKAKGFVHPGGAYEEAPDEQAGRISKLARGVMTRLHTEIERSVTFYRSQQAGGRPTRALLAGGGSSLGLTDLFFREKLKIPVEYFQSFRRIGIGAGVAQGELVKTFPSWACLVGAAIHSLPDSPCRINVLNSSQKASAALTKDRPALIAAGLGVAGLLLLPGIHGFWQGGRIQGLLGPQTTEVEAAEVALTKVEGEQKKLDETLRLTGQAIALEEERMRWPMLLEEIRERILPGLWITQLGLKASEPGQEGGGQSGPAGAKPGSPILEIGGFFETKSEDLDAKIVEEFRAALEKGGVLQKVVVTQQEAPERSADGKTEQVALKFSMKADWPMGNAGSSGAPAKQGAK